MFFRRFPFFRLGAVSGRIQDMAAVNSNGRERITIS